MPNVNNKSIVSDNLNLQIELLSPYQIFGLQIESLSLDRFTISISNIRSADRNTSSRLNIRRQDRTLFDTFCLILKTKQMSPLGFDR